MLKENPDYADLLDKLNSEAPVVTEEERKKAKLENSTIILNGLLTRILALKKCPQAHDALVQNVADLKRVIVDMYNTFKGFPITGDSIVDAYLARCHKA